MADAEKLRSLKAALTEQEKHLEEMRQRYGSPETRQRSADSDEHVHSAHQAIASALQTMRMLVDMLSEAGL